MIDSVTVHGDHAHRVAFQRFAIPSDQPSLERVVAALRIENARLARELAQAAAVTARLRTQLAIASGKPVEPPTEYEPQVIAPPPPKRPRAVNREPAYKRIPGGWLPVVLRGREPMTIGDIVKLTGKSRGAVKQALKKHRAVLISAGPYRARSHVLKPGA